MSYSLSGGGGRGVEGVMDIDSKMLVYYTFM